MSAPADDNASGPSGLPPADASQAPAPQDTRLTAGAPVGASLSSFTFSIAIPDLRNGSLVNIQQAAPKAAMSAMYHWPHITGLTYVKYVDAVEHLIRAAYAQMVQIVGASATAAQMLENRKKAIVLGAIRAGAASAYKLTPQDMLQHEVVSSGMEYRANPEAIVQASKGTTSNARWTSAQSMAALDADEEVVAATCVYIGMAVPVLQGVSLVMTGHHYIPTTYNMFKGIKRQALSGITQGARNWIEALGENFDDMAFHKACHTISPTLKRSLSKETAVALRLKASGHGAAAIRLPAVPSEASGGKASVALIRSATSTVRLMGIEISCEIGESLLRDLDDAAEGPEEAAACDAIVAWVSKNQQSLAFCAGVVQQVHETSAMGRNTILAAYSIKRIMADNPAEVSRGTIFARAAATKQRTQMEAGEFSNIVLDM